MDIQTEKIEKKNWKKTSSDPEAYAYKQWGMVRQGGKWLLFLIINKHVMHEMGSIKDDHESPFLWAKDIMSRWSEQRASAKWEERTINGRPGEEGRFGGKPIPKQTSVKKQGRAV